MTTTEPTVEPTSEPAGTTGVGFAPGALVRARGREWVVLPGSDEALLLVRPLGGGDDDCAAILRTVEPVVSATFAAPTVNDLGDASSAAMLHTALRIGFRSTAGPFRSLARLSVEPRAYQFVPLLLALRQPTTRVLIADDVGVGKTIEAGLVAAELLAQGDVQRLAVLCSPALAEQWQGELRHKFAIDAELVVPSTVTRLSRGLLLNESLFDRYPFVVVSTDFIKSHLRRQDFLNHCPELVIVDEAHGVVADGSGAGRARTQRYELVGAIADDVTRHLVLVTATPHSGKEQGFRNLIGLLHKDLATVDLEQVKGREFLARHMVQRRRADIRRYLNEETQFPSDRETLEVAYGLSKDYVALFEKVLAYAREQVTDTATPSAVRQRVRWWSVLALLRALSSSPKAAAATLRNRASGMGALTVEEADARPLSFLSAHIKVGNSLLGTTPALLAAGIPDKAFAVLEGDDKRHVAVLKKRSSAERARQGELFRADTVPVSNSALAARLRHLEAAPPTSLADVQLAEARLRELEHSPELRRARQVADTWCAAFVAVKSPGHPEITHATLQAAATGPLPHTLGVSSLDGPDVPADDTHQAVADLAGQYRFFHWHVEFPQIFTVPDTGPPNTTTGWTGGFSCVLGNPPWERIKLQEQEFFAARDPEIAEAPNAAARKKLIAALVGANPALHRAFRAAARRADGESAFLRLSGRYPLCGRGDINTYAVFAESNRNVLHPDGRLGIILPTGIATDATTQHFFKDLVKTRTLASLFGFYDRGKLFVGADVHGFCLLAIAGSGSRIEAAEFAFYLKHPDALLDADTRFTLTPEELLLLNPNTGTCPVFRSRRDAELTLGIYRRVPILIRHGDPDGNPWGLSFMTMFHMSNDSNLFRTREQLEADGWTLNGNIFTRPTPTGPLDRMLPLYEAKMVHHFDHRWATYDGADVRDMTQAEHEYLDAVALPRYWVAEPEVAARLAGRWDKPWLLGFRDIARSTDERTMISSVLPVSAVGHKFPLLMPDRVPHLFQAACSSLAFDFAARQKVGSTSMGFFIVSQRPAPGPETFVDRCAWTNGSTHGAWLTPRLLELTYTSHDLAPFARDLGDDGTPFRWNAQRRACLRAELDACFFHLYGMCREDTAYVLDTFPVVRRKDEAAFGEYRTKRLILEAFDAMTEAIATGTPYMSPLDPPPGQGPRHEGSSREHV